MEFNTLLAKQVELMRQTGPVGVASIPLSNGSHIPPMHQNSTCAPENTGPALKPENMHQPINTNLTNAFTNLGSSMHSCMQPAVDVSAHARRINVPQNMLLARSSNVGMMQGMNGGMIKAEAGYAGGSPYIVGVDGNVLDTRSAIGDAAVSAFSSVESNDNSHPLNDTLLEDTSAFEFLGQNPRSFSLSDLTADYSNSSDILESYSRSPFLTADADNFLHPHGRGNHQGKTFCNCRFLKWKEVVHICVVACQGTMGGWTL
ncbi:unnamed protein product [Ilex paraguariensis]|uniref:Uncharacterized protein n=1 Tax=Ilex paraguariensis TaxID=185542 RepID=A0ABC8RY86_9AQUA